MELYLKNRCIGYTQKSTNFSWLFSLLTTLEWNFRFLLTSDYDVPSNHYTFAVQGENDQFVGEGRISCADLFSYSSTVKLPVALDVVSSLDSSQTNERRLPAFRNEETPLRYLSCHFAHRPSTDEAELDHLGEASPTSQTRFHAHSCGIWPFLLFCHSSHLRSREASWRRVNVCHRSV